VGIRALRGKKFFRVFLGRLTPATFSGAVCSLGMNTFLKILLVAVALIAAIKLSPVLFVAAVLGLLAAVVLGAVGLSLVAAFLAVIVALTVALSPIWIPVLVVLGLISLFKKSSPPAPPVINAA
jgi:hypothetical protein